MPDFSIRWSALEARKPYASPFGVTFLDEQEQGIGGIAVNGPDLLYYSQFQQAVLRLAGELFLDAEADRAADPQRAWLDRVGHKLQPLPAPEFQPHSVFDERAQERRFRFALVSPAGVECAVDAPVLADYQELQAVLAHHTGRLFRSSAIEAVGDPGQRRSAWMANLRQMVRRPDADDRLAEAWPWR